MILENMLIVLSQVKDPRINRTKKHKLVDILVITVCAVLCKCDSISEVADFGEANEVWLKDFLELKGGIPSHDTFARVLSLINPLEFEKIFYEWVSSMTGSLENKTVAIDGKYFKATAKDLPENKGSRKLLGTMNAWCSKNGLVLAQTKADFEKKSEKIAIRELLKLINIKNCLVTLDAGGCDPVTANAVIERNGNFCIGLKGNQRVMLRMAKDVFVRKNDKIDHYETNEKGHGRKEGRIYQNVDLDNQFIAHTEKRMGERNKVQWQGLKSVTRVISTREYKGKVTEVERYFISSLSADAERIGKAIRSHWGIENKLHWVLDVEFNEDRCTLRKGASSENFSLIRKFCLNLLLKNNPSDKSIRKKRSRCCWSQEHLMKVLLGEKI